MFHPMRCLPGLTGVIFLCLVPNLAAQSPAEAGKKFQARCMSCHQAPDLQFATDRAWLERIKKTG